MGNTVMFATGTKEAYRTLATKDPQTLYFIEGMIYKGDIPYGNKVEIIDTLPVSPQLGCIYILPDYTAQYYDGNNYITISEGVVSIIDEISSDKDNKIVIQKAIKDFVNYREEETKQSVENALSVVDAKHYRAKHFERRDHEFERSNSIDTGSSYLLLFNYAQVDDFVRHAYENEGVLYALTNTLSDVGAKSFYKEISIDRYGVDSDSVSGAVWLCESYNNSETEFTIRNATTGQYLVNDGGNLMVANGSPLNRNYAWILSTRIFSETTSSIPYICSTITSASSPSNYIKANYNNSFVLSNEGQAYAGRNCNVYLYKLNIQVGQMNIKTYTTECYPTGNERAKTILLEIDYSDNADFDVWVTNEYGKPDPTWENATGAIKSGLPYIFSEYSDVDDNSGGIKVAVTVSGEEGSSVYCTGINYTVAFESDEKAPLNHVHNLGTSLNPGFTKLYSTPTLQTDGALTAAGTMQTINATANELRQEIQEAIAASDAMIFKGTIGASSADPTVTSLPATYRTGWTYRVITAGIYAGQVCEIGDLIIALVDRDGSGNKDSDWCVAQTNVDGAILTLYGGVGILISGSGTSRTISLQPMYSTDKQAGDNINMTPGFGDSFRALYAERDIYGRIKRLEAHNVTVPDTPATTNSNGLMSSSDKEKLDSLNIVADSTNRGQVKIYDTTGTNTDGTMTQRAITDRLDTNSSTISAITQEIDQLENTTIAGIQDKLDGISDEANKTDVTADYLTGTKIGSIGIDGVSTNLYVPNEYEKNTDRAIGDITSQIDSEHYYSKIFNQQEYPFTRDSSLKAGRTYLLLFNDVSWEDGIYKAYQNVGELYALTETTDAKNRIFSSEISNDRHGITPTNIEDIDNAMWICEPFNNSATEFKLKNVSNSHYIYNNNGSISYSSSASDSDNRFAWKIVNRNAEDDVADTAPYQGTKDVHIFTTITSVSDDTRFIRISYNYGNSIFKLGQTSQSKDGRNAGVYFYRLQIGSYDVNLHDNDILQINRTDDVSYSSEGGLAINTTAANVDLFTITLPDDEVDKNYRKIIVTYQYIIGSRVGFKYQKSDGTERFENNDNFRFPTNTTSKVISIDSRYQPVKKFFFISFNTGSQTIIKSITFSDPSNGSASTTKTKEYVTEPLITKTKRAKSIDLSINTLNPNTQSVYVTNDLGSAIPTWYDATEAVRVKTTYNFANYADVPANNGGVGVKVVVSGKDVPGYCGDITYRVTYEADEAGDLPIVTSADNGKILKVVNGEWDKGTVEESNEVVVIITRSGNNYTSSHSYNEINSLIQQGKKVIAKYDNRYYSWNPGNYFGGFGNISEDKNPYHYNQVRIEYFGWITSTDDLDSTTIRYFSDNACLLPDITNIGYNNKNYTLKPTLVDNKLGWGVAELNGGVNVVKITDNNGVLSTTTTKTQFLAMIDAEKNNSIPLVVQVVDSNDNNRILYTLTHQGVSDYSSTYEFNSPITEPIMPSASTNNYTRFYYKCIIDLPSSGETISNITRNIAPIDYGTNTIYFTKDSNNQWQTSTTVQQFEQMISDRYRPLFLVIKDKWHYPSQSYLPRFYTFSGYDGTDAVYKFTLLEEYDGTSINIYRKAIQISNNSLVFYDVSAIQARLTKYNGTNGDLVPNAPSTDKASKYLCADGSWKIPADINTTYTLSEASKSDTQYGDGAEIKLTDNSGSFSSVALTALADSGIVIQPVTGQTNIFNISLSSAVQTQLDGLAQLRADIDYVAMMAGVVLVEEEEVAE